MEIINNQSKEELENNLLKDIASKLSAAIDLNGSATLLLSGGSTPIALYSKLSQQDLPWEHITIGLVDERFVPTNDDFSNEKMIRKTLLQNNASKASLIGMVSDDLSIENNLIHISPKYADAFKRIDYCLLGMGADGHTASLFPGDQSSLDSLDMKNNATVITTNAPTFPHVRITCSFHFLLKSERIVLMITGNEKLDLLLNNEREKLPIDSFKNKMIVYNA